jgi:hypothetical protein
LWLDVVDLFKKLLKYDVVTFVDCIFKIIVGLFFKVETGVVKVSFLFCLLIEKRNLSKVADVFGFEHLPLIPKWKVILLLQGSS